MYPNLTTVAKVKDFLGIVSTDNDSTFAVLVKGVSGAIGRITGRNFEEGTYTEYLDGGQKVYFLPNWPVASLTTVKYRTGTWDAVVWTAFPASDYLLTEDTGRVNFSYCVPEYPKYIQIVYIGGYKIDFDHEDDITKHTLPYDLTQLTTEWVAKTFNTRKISGILSESTEGQSITFSETKKGAEEFEDRINIYRNYKI